MKSTFLLAVLACGVLSAAERTVTYKFDGEDKFIENTGVFADGVNGKALSFNGKQFAKVEFPLVANPKSLTVEFDVFIEKNTRSTIFGCFEEKGNKREFLISYKDGNISFAANGTGNANNTYSASLPVELNKWVHVSAQWYPGVIHLQVGDKTKKVSGPKKLKDTPIPMQLGRYWADRGMRHFTGKIDNLKITSSDRDTRADFKKKISPAANDKLLADFDFGKWKNQNKWGKPQWQVILGRWNVVNGSYCQLASPKTPHPQLAIVNQEGWKDYVVDALVKFLPGKSQRAGIGFRLQKSAPGFYPTGGYFVDIEETEEKCVARLYTWTQNASVTIPPFRMERTPLAGSQDDPEAWNLLCERRIKKDPAGEMHISVLCAGARIIVNINDEAVLKANSGAYSKGTVGVTSFGSCAAVKRIFVRELRPQEAEYASGIKLLSPADGQADKAMDPPVFRWEEVIDGEHDEKMDFCYDLQIAKDQNFTDIIYQADALYTLFHRPADKLPAGKFFWRVRRRSPRATMNWSIPRAGVSTGQIAPVIIGNITNRHTPAARPAWQIPVKGSSGEPVFALDGNKDILTVCKSSSFWTVTPKKDIDWGAHTLTVTNGSEKREWIVVRTEVIEPVSFRKDGILLVDGKPYFPVGTYRDPEDNGTDFQGTLAGNFNMTHSYWFEESGRGKKILDQDREYLDRVEKLGLTVFLGFSRKDAFAYGKKLDAAAKENIIRTAVRRLTSKSYITGTPHEEPDGGTWGLPPRAVGRVSRLIKEADPFHLTHSLLYRPQGFLDYSQSSDFIMIDPYPLPNEDLDQVYRRIVTARELSQKPVWMVLQAFDYRIASYRDSHVPMADEHRPSAQELKVMSYLALTAGAKGLIYYWWRNDVVHICKKYPDFYQAMAEQVKEIKALTPYLVSEETAPEVFPSDACIRAKAFTAEGKTLLIIVNPTGEKRPVKVALDGKNPRIMTFELAPYEVKTTEFSSR